VTFTDADPKGNLSQYSGTISWGDGTTTGGTFVTNPPGFAFGGTHTYAAPGVYKFTVTIRDVGGANATATTSMVVP
jgi:PKD repeat protein